MNQFGAYARKVRIQRRIPLESVAQALGYSAVYISDIERGNRNPPAPDKLETWAALLDVSINEFKSLAELDRGAVEIPVGHGQSQARDEIALALARAWKDLTPGEEASLKEALSDRLNGGDPK